MLLRRGRPVHYEGHLVVDGDTLRYVAGDGWVDIALNFFIGETDKVRAVGWDDDLKLAEHTDFFLRAKRAGLRVWYEPGMVAEHCPESPPGYAAYRDRGVCFAKRMLRKHGFRCAVGFEGQRLCV